MQVPHRQASTPRPPHVMFLTRPSPSLAIFIVCYVARAEEGLGTRLYIIIWGERERGPSCGLNGRAVTIDIYILYIYRRAYVHRYCACAALRANVAGRIGNRFSQAESAGYLDSASCIPHNQGRIQGGLRVLEHPPKLPKVNYLLLL